LQEEDGAGGAWGVLGQEGVGGGVEEGWVLGAIDEAGEVAVVAVGPGGGFVGERSMGSERASCWVAGMVKSSMPWMGWLKPVMVAGMPVGSIWRQSSGRKAMTKLTPPVVVRGSRMAAMAEVKAGRLAGVVRSNSR
jgi:hypothetical protein